MLSIYDGRSHFWQWDSDQRLTVASASTCEVHFQNPDGDTALTLDTYTHNGKTVVDVPNILLQNEGRITAWIFICVGDECTIFEKTFEVWHRQKPADYVYTETQLKSWNDKLNIQQGTDNAGAHLIVGEDGSVAPRQPGKLTLTGAAQAEYDGSAPVEVEIPVQQSLTITKGDETIAYDGSEAAAVDVPDVFVVTVMGGLSNRTQEEIRAAVAEKKLCLMYFKDSGTGNVKTYTYVGEQTAPSGEECPAFAAPAEYRSEITTILSMIFVLPERRIGITNKSIKVPNPRALTITKGAESTEYDGRKVVTVDVPDVLVVRVDGAASGAACSHTQAEIKAAIAAGKTCLLIDGNGRVYTYDGEATDYTQSPAEEGCPRFSAHFGVQGGQVFAWTVKVRANGTVGIGSSEGLKLLTIKQGDTSTTYNGSEAVTVEIAAGGGTVETATDAEVLQALADADLMTAVGGVDYVLTDENNNIIEW